MPDITEGLITVENASPERFKAVLEAALIECWISSKGTLLAMELSKCMVVPHPEVRLVSIKAFYDFASGLADGARAQVANAINANCYVVKASADGDTLYLEHERLLDGGVSPRSFAMALKRFCHAAVAAVSGRGGVNEL